MNSQESVDVGAVLDAYYDLYEYAGKPVAQWSEQAFADNPPRLYRYQRLRALLRAFGLPAQVSKLATASAVEQLQPADFQFLHDELTAQYEQGELATPPRPAPTGWMRLGMLYQEFFRLLQAQHQLLRFNSGWLEAGSAEAQYAILVAQRFVDSYDHAQLVAVRRTVCRLLDPAGRSFSRQELIRKFRFPDVDLDEVDFDWM